ncbi:MAG: CHAP domain-containing protein [Bacteroidota bacterium]
MKAILIRMCLLLGLVLIACQQPIQEGKGAMTLLEEEMVENKSPKKQAFAHPKINPDHVKIGQIIDRFNNIPIYFNGPTLNTQGRHVSAEGYNYGLKWQCVEFVKRYYYDHLHHEMPDTYGHAKHFFIRHLQDGQRNEQRDLYQFRNGGVYQPKVNDILVFVGDEYGHVAIISKVSDTSIEIMQQNVGVATRHTLELLHSKGRYYVMSKAVIGWLGQRKFHSQ